MEPWTAPWSLQNSSRGQTAITCSFNWNFHTAKKSGLKESQQWPVWLTSGPGLLCELCFTRRCLDASQSQPNGRLKHLHGDKWWHMVTCSMLCLFFRSLPLGPHKKSMSVTVPLFREIVIYNMSPDVYAATTNPVRAALLVRWRLRFRPGFAS